MLLCPADSLERAQVEHPYHLEWQAARDAEVPVSIFDFDGLRRGEPLDTVLRRVPHCDAPQTAIYRGWMLLGVPSRTASSRTVSLIVPWRAQKPTGTEANTILACTKRATRSSRRRVFFCRA